jgi:hypothetical protein
MSTADFYKDTLASVITMNKSLVSAQQTLFKKDYDKDLPQIFIVGAPRGGKMFTYSSLIRSLDIAYIDNITMRFWQAPLFGIYLSKNILQNQRVLSYSSHFGITPLSSDPGEFPYFWKDWLGTHENPKAVEDVDWEGLQFILHQMASAHGKPLSHQALDIFYHLDKICTLFTNALFIRLWRNPIDNAMSILKARMTYTNRKDEWISFRPSNYTRAKELPWQDQIAQQLYGIKNDMTDRLSNAKNVINLSFDEQCANPGGIVDAVEEWLKSSGYPVERLAPPPEPYVPRGYPDNEDKQKLTEALERLFTAEELHSCGMPNP